MRGAVYSVLRATTGSFFAAEEAGMMPEREVKRMERRMRIKASVTGRRAMFGVTWPAVPPPVNTICFIRRYALHSFNALAS